MLKFLTDSLCSWYVLVCEMHTELQIQGYTPSHDMQYSRLDQIDIDHLKAFARVVSVIIHVLSVCMLTKRIWASEDK